MVRNVVITFIASQGLSKIYTWITELCTLSDIAKTHSKVAYSAPIHGVFNRWTYLFRT